MAFEREWRKSTIAVRAFDAAVVPRCDLFDDVLPAGGDRFANLDSLTQLLALAHHALAVLLPLRGRTCRTESVFLLLLRLTREKLGAFLVSTALLQRVELLAGLLGGALLADGLVALEAVGSEHARAVRTRHEVERLGCDSLTIHP